VWSIHRFIRVREIKLLFDLQRDLSLLAPRFNIAPSQEVPVMVQKEGVNELKTISGAWFQLGHLIVPLAIA
jgi:hypothetical protein